ncbi:hypothetical protein KBC40_01210 [Patescibacteria group bacterium]|nr:hypothetical protein [Patescibacteria group bacterium]
MKKEQFIQLLGKTELDHGSFNIGLVLYKNESDLAEINKYFPDSNQISTTNVSLEFDSPNIQSIFEALEQGRVVKVIVDKDLNSDFFMFINYLSKYAKLKFDQQEKDPDSKAKLFVCMTDDEYNHSNHELGDIFYPILNV